MKARNLLYSLGLVAMGAIVGMLFAPATGRRSRALIRDKMVKAGHEVSEFAGKRAHHVTNRTKGYYHDALRLLRLTARRAEAEAEEKSRAA